MHLSENEGIEGKTFVVTGGLGFVGSALCLELVRRGAHQIRALDLQTTSPWSHRLLNKGVHCIRGDITKKQDVERALRGANCVFHLASYGMSGKEMLQYGHVDEVNVNGTCHVLEACVEHGIKRLVYVSTYNVVFGGKEIINGNETLPYFPLDDHVDPYSRSKSIAEQLVLKSNGRPFKKKNGNLYTCAIRPAAIYGPGEERHLPRIINLAKLGLLPFKIGEARVKTDWIYIDNLVMALILASMGLLEDIPQTRSERRPIAGGQPYFISDGSPVNSFEFIRPILQSLEYDLPKQSLAVHHALLLGRMFWVAYTILYPWLNRWWLPQPLMLPAEVYKVGVSHYFSFLKAKEELGYVPLVSPREGMAATISYWQERKRRSLDGPTIYAWLFSVIGMTLLFAAAYGPDCGPVSLIRGFSLFFFRSMWAVRMVSIFATAAHIGEAIYAWRLAKKVDPSNSGGWFWQTLALGMFSLRFLLKRARN
ncbi:Short-chain dehydrogenase/reductase family 42E member like [Actinidia chinensis var. chinensis]|uniref:Short-chain dehydrogenase/reductase family 42E member like n=1 Tax=Actinidia chinensis var. chinensis TaxID=1590841 RepID=A0A2R6RMD4_ACTCC|nr:Short-chain dehydrogenase/reductase family 42E member like [Actinidia chinensis var. chinensis]